ncbi:hypothetical protein BD779DRAFT_1622349 [Infundibulicybe gibba]|nr:hypothetical protein BD779DRAFT_1622349 [Infundibulicybe gibba]
MCGRFALRLGHDEIARAPVRGRGALPNDWIDQDRFLPRYNIAPRTYAPVVRRREPGTGTGPTDDSSSLVLHTMRWGLVPHWAKVEDRTLSTTNARSEALVEGGGIWGSVRARKRCAVICQGYYEWLTKGKNKIPHFTRHKDGQLMLMAGLYDSVVLEGGTEPLWTFSIVTTAANSEFSWLHERQPVILSTRVALDSWLDTSKQTWDPSLARLLRPFSDDQAPLECYQVPLEVGKVGTESPTFIQPVSQRKDGIQAMFSKQKLQRPTAPGGSAARKFIKTEAAVKQEHLPAVAVIDLSDEYDQETREGEHEATSLAGGKRKRSSSIIDTSEGFQKQDRDTIEDVEQKAPPRTPKKHKSHPPNNPTSGSKSPVKSRARKVAPGSSPARGSGKITAFFGTSRA